jgi:hypothetical protein
MSTALSTAATSNIVLTLVDSVSSDAEPPPLSVANVKDVCGVTVKWPHVTSGPRGVMRRMTADACSDLSLTVFSAMNGTGDDCKTENTAEKGLLKIASTGDWCRYAYGT